MAKKPTRRQCILISNHGLKPDNWLVTKNPVGYLHIRHNLRINQKPGFRQANSQRKEGIQS